MRRVYITIFYVLLAFLSTACESESDKRKAEIERLEKISNEAQKKIDAIDKILEGSKQNQNKSK